MNTNLSLGGIITQGIKLGIFNIISIFIATILWALTIWIPYLNVGTTIGLLSMPIGISKGNTKTYDNLAELEIGDLVNFSGRFMYDSLDNKDYLWEESATESGSMEIPELRFIFNSIDEFIPTNLTIGISSSYSSAISKPLK